MVKRFLAPWAEHTYAILRIVIGLLFAFHGAQKVFGILFPHDIAIGSQAWIGGLIELVGGILISLGLFTRYAAFLCSGTMAVAYVQFHWKLQLGAKFLPAINQGELAVVYAFLFLFIACRGAGIWSLDGDRR